MKLRFHQFEKKIFFLCSFIFCEILILGSRVQGLHNSQLLIDVGDEVIHRTNPFVPPQPYGTFSGLIYFILHKITFSTQNPLIFILLNLLGIFLLITYFNKEMSNYEKLFLLSILLFTSPIRALVGNVQHTGVILGSLIVGGIFYKYSLNSKHKVLLFVCASLSFVFAIDLKPQIALPYIIIFILLNRTIKLMLLTLILIILNHLIVDLWVGRFLEFDQIAVWRLMEKDSLAVSEQTSIWKLLNELFSSNIDWFKISFVLYICGIISLVYLTIKKPKSFYLQVALLLPLVTAYLHLYDIVLLAIMVVSWAMRNTKRMPSVFLLGLLTIPVDINSNIDKFYWLVFLLPSFLVLHYRLRGKVKIGIIFGIEIFMAYVVVLYISRLSETIEFKVSIQIAIISLSALVIKIINEFRRPNLTFHKGG